MSARFFRKDGKIYCLTSLYSDSPFQSKRIYISFGMYDEKDRMEWTGEHVSGHITDEDLLKLGLEKGFLKYEKCREGRD